MVFKSREFSEKRNRSNAFVKNGRTQAFPKKNKTYGAPDAQDEKTARSFASGRDLRNPRANAPAIKGSTQKKRRKESLSLSLRQLYLGIL